MAQRAEVAVAGREIEVAALTDAERRDWDQILSQSGGATLFHDLRFLEYHPKDRFRFHHLIFHRGGRPIALLPGGHAGPAENPLFRSPLGGSFGGFTLPQGARAELALGMVDALQTLALGEGWAGIEITLPPAPYAPEVTDLAGFALFCRGFRLEHRWLSHLIAIPAMTHAAVFEHAFRPNQAAAVRSARRREMQAVVTGVEGLALFLPVFRDTYARHGRPATHTEAEIADLLTRLPNRIRLHLALLDEEPVAGILEFRVTASVAYTFYICSSSGNVGANGAAFLIAHALDRLAAEGVRYLDLGPSASDMNFNAGVTFFKEGLGAFGACRDRWLWRAP